MREGGRVGWTYEVNLRRVEELLFSICTSRRIYYRVKQPKSVSSARIE
jgi:hypothetical protein